MSTQNSQVDVAVFPSSYHIFYHYTFPGFPFILIFSFIILSPHISDLTRQSQKMLAKNLQFESVVWHLMHSKKKYSHISQLMRFTFFFIYYKHMQNHSFQSTSRKLCAMLAEQWRPTGVDTLPYMKLYACNVQRVLTLWRTFVIKY